MNCDKCPVDTIGEPIDPVIKKELDAMCVRPNEYHRSLRSKNMNDQMDDQMKQQVKEETVQTGSGPVDFPAVEDGPVDVKPDPVKEPEVEDDGTVEMPTEHIPTVKEICVELQANIELIKRHLEDARMRVGKILQAADDGVSILDK